MRNNSILSNAVTSFSSKFSKIFTDIYTILKGSLSFMNSRIRKKKAKLQSTSTPQIKVNNASQSSKWIVVGESVIGKSHISGNLPCQDANFFKVFKKNWGIAIVCDGAGSAEKSDRGAEFCAIQALPRYFEDLINREQWIEKEELPLPEEWQQKATHEFKNALGALSIVANENKIELSKLACTVIVVIFSPLGLLIAHIGDGRAGYCDKENGWQSMMIPHKGEEANQTIFLTSNSWYKDSELKMSGVYVPECRVIKTVPTAFVLMSDGCEQHSFECSLIDSNTGSWSDPNKPYSKFFDPLVSTLHNMATSSKTVNIQESWSNFLKNGTEGLINESDDKTMILGILQ
jgi:hypothetical protein